MFDHLKRLLKGSAIYGLGSALNQGLALMLLPLFTSYLTPTDYGIISVLSLWSTLMITLFSLGIGVSFGLAYYDSVFEQDDVIWTALIILFLSSGIMLTLNIIFSKEISLFLLKSSNLKSYIIIYAFISLFSILINLFTLIFQLKEKQAAFVLSTTITSLLSIFLSIFLIVFLKYGVWGRLIALFLSTFISFCFLLFQINCKPKLIFNIKTINFLINKGIIVLPSFFAIYILQQGNTYIIQHFSGLEQAGLYAIGFNFGNGMNMLIQAFSLAWLPFAMSLKDKPEEAAYTIGKISTYYIMIIGVTTLLFFIYAKPLIMVFTQPQFFMAFQIIGLSALSFFLVGLFNIINIESYLAQELRPTIIIQIISSLIFIWASLQLTQKYQSWGASLSLVIGYFLIILLLFTWNKRQKNRVIKIKYEKKSIYILILYILFIFNNQIQPIDFNFQSFFFDHLLLVFILIFQYYSLDLNEKSKIKYYLKKISF
ncbi:MAG: lipopolysaccharide biosynthesis protein [Candidatus Sericytochromatia bacterium]